MSKLEVFLWLTVNCVIVNNPCVSKFFAYHENSLPKRNVLDEKICRKIERLYVLTSLLLQVAETITYFKADTKVCHLVP